MLAKPGSSPAPPSFALEFRRGLNRYNLTVGLVSAVAIGVVAYGAIRFEIFPPLFGLSAGGFAALVGVIAFVAITGLHTAAHAYFGWRFGRGLAARAAGNKAKARRLLAPAAWKGMDHYDPHGIALETLREISGKNAVKG